MGSSRPQGRGSGGGQWLTTRRRSLWLAVQETVDLMWRNHLKEDMLPYSLNGWTSDPETGYGLGLSITCHDDITTYKWDKHTGGGRICEVGWGGGASTNWQVSHSVSQTLTHWHTPLSAHWHTQRPLSFRPPTSLPRLLPSSCPSTKPPS